MESYLIKIVTTKMEIIVTIVTRTIKVLNQNHIRVINGNKCFIY